MVELDGKLFAERDFNDDDVGVFVDAELQGWEVDGRDPERGPDLVLSPVDEN
jgi:hypothetical protein